MWPNSKNVSAAHQAALANLEKNLARLKAEPEFDQVLTQESRARVRRFIAGVKTYQQHPVTRDIPDAPVIWRAGSVVLRDYNPAAQQAPIVLVIPSLINRFDILDLDLDHSFLRALAQKGYRPLVVDWQMPGKAEENFMLADYITERLMPVMDFIRGLRNVPVHVLGYCMGGMLGLVLAQLNEERIKTLTLMATPWDFHRPNPVVGAQFLNVAANVEPVLQTLGHLPVDVIQSLFAFFQPLQTMTKFTDFAAMDPDSTEARHFVLLEDWLKNGIPLTAPVARERLHGFYGMNNPARGAWRVEGDVVDPTSVAVPSYIIVPGKDRIVPPESALPLAKLLPHATLHEPMMGHIGMIASRQAPQHVWTPYFHWLAQHV